MTKKSHPISTDTYPDRLAVPTMPAWMIAETQRAKASDLARQSIHLEAPTGFQATWMDEDDETSFTLQF